MRAMEVPRTIGVGCARESDRSGYSAFGAFTAFGAMGPSHNTVAAITADGCATNCRSGPRPRKRSFPSGRIFA